MSGSLFARRIRLAHRDHLSNGAPTLTLRALEAFPPGVLWTLLQGLEYLPEEYASNRSIAVGEEPSELELAHARLVDAKEDGRPELIAMAAEMLAETRDRVVVTARARRGGARKESSRRRSRVLARLLSGLVGWKLVDVARLVLESLAWDRPPCPLLVGEYAGCEAELADALAKGRARSGRNTPL